MYDVIFGSGSDVKFVSTFCMKPTLHCMVMKGTSWWIRQSSSLSMSFVIVILRVDSYRWKPLHVLQHVQVSAVTMQS